MVQIVHGNTADLVQRLSEESSLYARQWALWTGIGNGAAILAVLSFSASLRNPDAALHQFLPSLWLFLFGVISSGLSLPSRAHCASATADHFAESHNRDECQAATRKIPEMISSPRSLAEEYNKERNQLIERGNRAHARAEKAWSRRAVWRIAGNVFSITSGVSFVLGVALPLLFLTLGGTLGK